MSVAEELAEIQRWWAGRPAGQQTRIAGGPHDQSLPLGVENPYWQIIRQLPGRDGMLDGFARGLPVGHHLLTKRYAWAIPSPGDIGWLADLLGGRGLVEIGAGSGYWTWQAVQAGIDAIAYEPTDPAVNTHSDGFEYVPLLRGGPESAAQHEDRVLLLCWPSNNDPWAAQSLTAYPGDLLVYVGEGPGGTCADAAFFALLARDWTPFATSPHHLTWTHAPCSMTAYRRRPDAVAL